MAKHFKMPYNITLTTGEMHVLLDNGDTQAFNLGTGVSMKVMRNRQFNQVPDPTGPAGPLTTSIVIAVDYAVKLRFNDDSEYDIIMGTVDNQAGWLNTQAGANQCVTDLQAALN